MLKIIPGPAEKKLTTCQIASTPILVYDYRRLKAVKKKN